MHCEAFNLGIGRQKTWCFENIKAAGNTKKNERILPTILRRFSMNSPPFAIKVWGEYACFTRPEFGVERVTYEVMTPSAARGVLEAIFWKPEFLWRILELHALAPVARDWHGKALGDTDHSPLYRTASILRNEINTRQSDRTARGWTSPGDGFYSDEDRAQRHTLCLRDAAYVIRAQMQLMPHANAPINKYTAQFQRRLERGQCHHQPYLGTRECSAYFTTADQEKAVNISSDLGLMLFDLDFTPAKNGTLEYFTHDADGGQVVAGTAAPKFFQATLERGVLRVPQTLYGGAT
jgi:CRISPR-associated protein Cas5d